MIDKRFSCSAAFTLIEVVVVMVIVGIMGAVTLSFLGNSARLYAVVLAQRRADGELLDAVDRMRREARTVRTIAGGTLTNWSFVNAQTASVTVAFDNNCVMLNDNPLACGVAFCEFKYFDGANQELNVPLSSSDFDNVGRIELALRVTNNLADAETIVNFHLLKDYLK